MRFFLNFTEAKNELRRELKEMGIKIHTKSVQGFNIENIENMGTLELQNYTYTILNPQLSEIPLKCPEWAEAEFKDRVSLMPINPGTTYKLREELWRPMLNKNGIFDYTYPERMLNGLPGAIKALQQDIYTRRAFIGVWDPVTDNPQAFDVRVPCTLGYWLNYRQDKLNITYLLRSSDFGEHFNYDVFLATKLMNHIAGILGVEPGSFTHWIGSFHVFEKDVEGVF